MSKEPLSLFHEHLLLFLQNDLREKKKREGWDETVDSEIRSYRDLLSHSIRGSEPLKLQEIIEKYELLFKRRGPVHLEHKILEAFPEAEMKRLGFTPLRIVRGLPRLFCKNAPVLVSKIHPAFSHLPSLKRAALAKPLYSMYAGETLPKDAKVAILALPGADAYLAEDMAHQMKQAFASLEVRVALFPGMENERELRGFDLLLQLSPQITDAVKKILTLDDPRPLPKVERIASQGFPNQAAHPMGLHFLQRGIFIKSFRTTALESDASAIHEIEANRKEKRFFFAHLSSQTGVFVYMHALFKSLEWDNKEIDLCIPNAKPFLDYFESRHAGNLPVLEKSYQISKITLCIGSESRSFDLSPIGKTVRIFLPDRLSDAELSRLLLLSEDFIGVSECNGFSSAVSANKGFFYDPSTLSTSFVKDLSALAENRIAPHRSTLSILRLYTKVFEQQCKLQDNEWVDEISIQCEEIPPLLELAEKIGFYLQDPDALAGFKKLNRLIAKEHSCNAFLFHLVQRAVCHRRRPQIACLEEDAVSKFIQNEISLSHFVQHLQDAFLS